MATGRKRQAKVIKSASASEPEPAPAQPLALEPPPPMAEIAQQDIQAPEMHVQDKCPDQEQQAVPEVVIENREPPVPAVLNLAEGEQKMDPMDVEPQAQAPLEVKDEPGVVKKSKTELLNERILAKNADVIPKDLMMVILGMHHAVRQMAKTEQEFEAAARLLGMMDSNEELACKMFILMHGKVPTRRATEMHYRAKLSIFNTEIGRYTDHRKDPVIEYLNNASDDLIEAEWYRRKLLKENK